MPHRAGEWFVPRSSRAFATRLVEHHERVDSVEVLDRGIRFKIRRRDGLSPVDALLIDRYVIGVADVIAAQAAFPGINCVFAPGNWCGYTQEAKEYGFRSRIAVFHVGEFSGALWHRDFLHYVKEDRDGFPDYAYRTGPPN